MRHDLQHVVTALELANLLSGEEISDLNSYETVFAAYPELTQENMMLRELLRWQGLVNLKAEALRRIYDRILMHINKAAQFKSTIDKLVRLDGSQDNSAAQYYLASSRGVDSEFRLFTSTFNRLKNEIDNPGKKEMININSSIKEVVDVYASNYSSYKYNLRLDDRVDSLFIPANALQLSCVWKNLISNAREVAVSNGEISVTSRIVEKEGEKFVEVAFTDNGHPIEENMLAGRRLFREGESSKSKNGGTGLLFG